MGVKFGREYEDILEDIQKALVEIEDIYLFLGMLKKDWTGLSKEEQQECLITVADDVFYGLGEEPTLFIGQGKITYQPNEHLITIQWKDEMKRSISLIEVK
ncbi:MAG: hypothetical protein GX962_02795 [Epulopiscium sp.]|nr:hypothetical protein [Candidatus Epulonipiscium sp.]